MADSPYINWYTSDFLHGVSDLTAEEGWVYTIVLMLIADKGAPINDDPASIGHRCKLSTRKTGAILTHLEAEGKISRRNGLIGNKRILSEVTKRDSKGRQARDAANEKWRRWRAENKPQLPLEGGNDNGRKKDKKVAGNRQSASADAQIPGMGENEDFEPIISEKNAKKTPEKTEIIDPIISGEAQKTANGAMRTHSDSRAGAIPEPEYIQSNDHKTLGGSAHENAPSDDRPIGPEQDLVKLLEAVSAAAGFIPSSPDRMAKAIDLIRQWRDLGVDFDGTVIPTIRAVIADSTDPTSSLLRFDKRIRHEHARRTGRPLNAPPPPIAVPELEFPDEHAQFKPLRAELLKHLGTARYCALVNSVRFAHLEDDARNPLILNSAKPGAANRLFDGETAPIVRSLARKLGFRDVWIGR
jgi:uncharacterized protein YdaU (DUF1376 family)